MKLSLLIVSRPILIFIFLAIVVLLLPSLVIPCWYKMTKNVKVNVDQNINQFHYALLSEVDNIAKALQPLHSSSPSLAKLISAALNKTELSTFDTVIVKMGPLLFQALTTIPHISQISYIGLEGPFLSYYNEGNQIYAMYSNSSFSSSSNAKRTLNVKNQNIWYKQLVHPDSGKLYGDATVVSDLISMENTSFILQKAINSTDYVYASLGSGWNSDHDPLILNSVGINGSGVLSLGFALESLAGFFNGVKIYGGNMYLATQNGEMLIRGSLDTQMVVNDKSVSFHLLNSSSDEQLSSEVGNVTCMANNGTSETSLLMFGKSKYMAYCSPVEIFGLQSVFALILPHNNIVARIHRTSEIALILLIVTIVTIFICILTFAWFMIEAKTREMQLCSSLIKQMEATQQAERKSMNKSLAFASASHDIRTALAGITGLIELCYEEVAPASELEINLKQMNRCTEDLRGLLNSVLDMSKIEAGKMQLEDEEFDLPYLLEDVVDLFHPVAAKKGVDVVLDPCDGSTLKMSNVRGDRGKLKQVMCNLLSNAVKFTSQGHISVRAWAQKPRLENKIISSNQNMLWKHFSACLRYKNDEEYGRLESMNTTMQNPNIMEFVFEVEDTGAGIPKEKQKSVFENFVQVKETALGTGGTGLGLGIVQSIVRLMGGEIAIVDKENGERGTCFRFNVFLTALGISSAQNSTKPDVETLKDQNQGLTVRIPVSASLMNSSTSPRLSKLGPASKSDGSIVVLLIKNEERRRSTQKFMESLGIKVVAVSQWENLYSTLMKLKSKQILSPYSSSGKSEFGSRSDKSSGGRSKDAPLSIMDGTDQPNLPSYHRSSTLRGVPSFVLLVIDASAGPFQDLYEVVAEFRRGLHDTSCKVVWFNRPSSRNINIRNNQDEENFQKPFHGSRLYQAIRLLPEFRGAFPSQVVSEKEKYPFSPSADESSQSTTRLSYNNSLQNSEIQAEGSSRHETSRKRSSQSGSSGSKHSGTLRQLTQKHSEIEEIGASCSIDKPLSGIKFLVAEDSTLLQKLAMANLLMLGANVELCANGEEAVELVRINIQDQAKHGNYFEQPYNYILMDCEMPKMDGFEATREIRKIESEYGIHIPIIALTAHTSGGDSERTKEAGMDAHLGKPLKKEHLLETIRNLHSY